MKKSFTLLELIFTLIILSIVISTTIPKPQHSNLDLAANRVILYLKHTRYLGLIDNKLKLDDDMWYKERWTMKFQNCASSIGGLYFVVFSDINHKGSPNKNECAKDPITSRWLYSHWDCNPSDDESKYILLTKEYGVTKVDISCNSTSTIGSISFGNTGQAYSRLGTKPQEVERYKLTQTCYIKLFDKDDNFVKIAIEPNTGFIHRIN
ncbi:MAG: type II secretion system protein [Campylobacteraceae bacterium]|jgi:hypothetical protein|nr:type II secretion system protein [Campylobacteraceae bacterium]MBT3882506.1 type II secretion system protein [Campylobacteraceae bacterium]MBT4179897.1 type II secretion system protein [Campylobacteraceae bacterium]MBT4708306.1 type II secretion system protein [Campylobacteraceae bacterium]MBT5324247.1 type II secretion system protein [Campylobacteraceae bacterium]